VDARGRERRRLGIEARVLEEPRRGKDDTDVVADLQVSECDRGLGLALDVDGGAVGTSTLIELELADPTDPASQCTGCAAVRRVRTIRWIVRSARRIARSARCSVRSTRCRRVA